MRTRTLAFTTLAAMVASSALALAVPMPQKSTPSARFDRPGPTFTVSRDRVHSAPNDALGVDVRLGHSALGQSASDGGTFLYAQMVGADEPTARSLPVQVALVIDRSGSMQGARIQHALDAAVGLVERLRDGDTVSVVAFSDAAEVIVPPTESTAFTRQEAVARIRGIRLAGNTCISCGIEEAMRQLDRARAGTGAVSRMIVLSDGAANRGVSDASGLGAIAARMRDRCSISTVGVDVDFDERVMSAIAQASNGHHHFVASAADLPAVFSREFDSLTSTVADDTELAVDLAPGVEVERVFDRGFRREGSRLVIPLGPLGAKQEKTVLVKLRVPTESLGQRAVADVRVDYRDVARAAPVRIEGALALDVVQGIGSELDPFVATRVERSRTADTLTEVNTLFERGEAEAARRRLDAQKGRLFALSEKAKAGPSKPDVFGNTELDDLKTQSAAVDVATRGFDRAEAEAPLGAAPAAEGHAGKVLRKENAQNGFRLQF